MWLFWIATILLFYFFAILQNSFFVHFLFFGIAPNLIFIFFFLLVFFNIQKKYYNRIIFALIAGFLLDIFSEIHFGISIFLLVVLGFFINKIKKSLMEKDEKHPFSYFAFLFSISLLLYEIISILYLNFMSKYNLLELLNIKFLWSIIYNLIFATLGFFIYKKLKK